MFDYGLFRATAAKGAWKQIYTIKTPGDPATGLDSRVEFSLTSLAGGKTRIYLGDATYYDNSVAGFLRSDDGTATAPSFQVLSDPTPGSVGYGSYNFCQAQCSYDMAVTSPVGGNPDEVFLSGSMNYDELTAFGGPGNSNGRAVVRSATAGASFTDMTNDNQPKRNGLHPDQHALVIVPGTSGQAETFFTGSDGGVVQQHGPYVDQTSECTARKLSGANLADCQHFLKEVPTLNQEVNRGLQTLQYQSVSVTPERDRPGRHAGQRHLGERLQRRLRRDGRRRRRAVRLQRRHLGDPLPLVLLPAARRELPQGRPGQLGLHQRPAARLG